MRDHITLSTWISPSGAGSTPHHVMFSRPERHVPSMVREPGRYRHPAEPVVALVWTAPNETISEVLDYHYGRDGWSKLIVAQEAP